MQRLSPVRLLALVMLLAAFVVLQVHLWFGSGGRREVSRLRVQVEQLKAENAVLQQRNELMAADVNDLKHGTDEVEEIARKDLGMIRSNETFYQVLGSRPANMKQNEVEREPTK